MKNRERTARGLVILGSLLLFAAAALHGFAGYPFLSRALSTVNLNSFLQGGLRALWLLVSWHWVAVGVIALVLCFGGATQRKPLLLICGLLVLVDAIGVFIGVGFFLGDETLGVAGLAFLLAAALFEGGHGPQA
jgi:hypothetical protein